MPDADQLVGLMQRGSTRWLELGRALQEAIDQGAWKANGAPSATAWLDHLAVRGGRSATYLARCMSGARYVDDLKCAGFSVNDKLLALRPLSAIEELRRHTSGDPEEVAKLLPLVESGRLKYQDFRRMIENNQEPARRSEQAWFSKAVEDKLPKMLDVLNCPSAEILYREAGTPVGRFDAVLVDHDNQTTIVEIKQALSSKSLLNIVQQLIAYSHLAHRVWLVLPAGSELPAETIIQKLGQLHLENVGIILLQPADLSVAKVLSIRTAGPISEARTAFRDLLRSLTPLLLRFAVSQNDRTK